MGIFDQMAQAKVQNRGIKIAEDGNFIVRVDKIKIEQSNQGFGQMWVVEFTIVDGTEDNPAGAERSWVQRPETRAQTDPGNIKAFIAALDNISDPNNATIPPEKFAEAAGPSQPYKNRYLRLNTQMVTTKAGFEFCVHNWSYFDGDISSPPPPVAQSTPPEPELTKERWLAGEGPAQLHPSNAEYEWSPEHPEWGVRSKTA